jgi:hypothetical protein
MEATHIDALEQLLGTLGSDASDYVNTEELRDALALLRKADEKAMGSLLYAGGLLPTNDPGNAVVPMALDFASAHCELERPEDISEDLCGQRDAAAKGGYLLGLAVGLRLGALSLAFWPSIEPRAKEATTV